MKLLQKLFLAFCFVAPAFAQEQGSIVVSGTIGQRYLNTNWNILVLTNAGSSGANGRYDYAGVRNTFPTWTNDATPAFQVISNGSVSRFEVTNTGDGTFYYRKSISGGNYPSGSTMNVQSGSAPAPTMLWTNRYYATNRNISIGKLGRPFLSTASLTNESAVSMTGSDSNGIPGVQPFSSIDGAILYSTNVPLYIRVAQGNYAKASNSLPDFTYIEGAGRTATIIGDTVENSITFTVGDTNVFRNLATKGVFHNPQSVAVTNSLYENCELGSTNQIDTWFQVGNPDVGFYNVTANNCHLISSWDITQGVISGTFNNCIADVYWFSTNTFDISSFTGCHALMMGNVAGVGAFNYVVNGGTYTIGGGVTTSIAGTSNSCIEILGTNVSLTLNGPALNHSASNGVYHAAIYNPAGCTNVNGFYYDNGQLCYINSGVITVVTNVGGGGGGSGTTLSTNGFSGQVPVLTTSGYIVTNAAADLNYGDFTKPIILIIGGDSIAFGLNDTHNAWYYLTNNFAPTGKIVLVDTNAAISGQQSQAMLTKLRPEWATYSTSNAFTVITVIQIGINDFLNHSNATMVYSNVNQAFKEAHASNTLVVATCITPATDLATSDRAQLDVFNPMLVVNTNKDWISRPDMLAVTQPNPQYWQDHVHPTDLGQSNCFARALDYAFRHGRGNIAPPPFTTSKTGAALGSGTDPSGATSTLYVEGQYPILNMCYPIGGFGGQIAPLSAGMSFYYSPSAVNSFSSTWLHMIMTGTNSYFVMPVAMSTNASNPKPPANVGFWYVSNKCDLYWVTSTKTNAVAVGN